MTGYVYVQTEHDVYSVGYFTPDGAFHPESDWTTIREAARRVNYLNGGTGDLQAVPA